MKNNTQAATRLAIEDDEPHTGRSFAIEDIKPAAKSGWNSPSEDSGVDQMRTTVVITESPEWHHQQILHIDRLLRHELPRRGKGNEYGYVSAHIIAEYLQCETETIHSSISRSQILPAGPQFATRIRGGIPHVKAIPECSPEAHIPDLLSRGTEHTYRNSAADGRLVTHEQMTETRQVSTGRKAPTGRDTP